MPQLAPQDRASDTGPTCVTAVQFRSALSKLATAVSVITTDGPAGTAGITCSTVCALSDDPAMVLFCIHGKSAANAAIKVNGILCVNCLQAGQSDLSQAFAGIGSLPMRERFALGDWDALLTGAPRCRSALISLDCEVADVKDIGTHSVFVAKVLATSEARDGAPLLYQQRSYVTTRNL